MEQRERMQGKNMKNFNFNKILGSGSYGTVYQAIHQKTKKVVAIKVISQKSLKAQRKLKQLVQSQIKILKEVKNQNVIKFIDSFSSKDSIFIVTEFCNGGDLQKYCQSIGKVPQKEAVTLLKQILNGFKGLHQVDTMHRDFKLANVLLHDKICKIADLGFAKQLKKQVLTTTMLGTDETMAPQVSQGKNYGWGADIWSLGIVFYQMLYEKTPFRGLNQYTKRKNMKSGQIDFSGIEISNEAIDFIKKCLTYDPKQRITWKAIYEHPLLSKKQLFLDSLLIRSSLNVNANQLYYKNNQQTKRKTIILKDSNLIEENNKQDELLFSNGGEIKNANTKNMEEFIKNRQKIDIKFQQYEQQILKERNNKMFGISLIVTQEKSLQKLANVKHSGALYELCKESFIQMKKLSFGFQNDSFGSYKSHQFWRQFKELNIFKTISQLLEQDQMLAEALTVSYSADLSSSEIKYENYNRASDSRKSRQILETYYKELIPQINKEKNKNLKPTLYKMLKALEQLKQGNKVNCKEFEEKIKNFDWKVYEKQLQKNK